jgi:hypothetical protein
MLGRGMPTTRCEGPGPDVDRRDRRTEVGPDVGSRDRCWMLVVLVGGQPITIRALGALVTAWCLGGGA